MIKYLSLIFIISLAWVSTSCTDEVPVNITEDDTRIYLSNFDTKADFSQYKIYFIMDSVLVMSNGRTRYAVGEQAKMFLAEFRSHMERLGYIRTFQKTEAQAGIQVCEVSRAKIGAGSSYNKFHNKYWGFEDFADKGFEYPGYYDTYTHGDPVWNIEMVDLKNARQNEKLKVIWNAQIWGQGIFDPNSYALIQEKLFEISTFLKGK